MGRIKNIQSWVFRITILFILAAIVFGQMFSGQTINILLSILVLFDFLLWIYYFSEKNRYIKGGGSNSELAENGRYGKYALGFLIIAILAFFAFVIFLASRANLFGFFS